MRDRVRVRVSIDGERGKDRLDTGHTAAEHDNADFFDGFGHGFLADARVANKGHIEDTEAKSQMVTGLYGGS